MSEQSILDYASAQSDDVAASAGQRLQTLISMVNENATQIAYKRAEKAREAAARSDAERREIKERQDALYKADRLVWGRVWNDRFWDRATHADIERAWEACAPWATAGFPEASRTLEYMRDELRDRFGIDVPMPPAGRPGDLARLFAVDAERDRLTDPDRHADAGLRADGLDDAAASADRDALTTISYRIRDAATGDLVTSNVVHLGRGEGSQTALLIGAAALAEFGDVQGRELAVEVVAGGDPAASVVLHSVGSQQAHAVLQEHAYTVAAGPDHDLDAARRGEGERILEALRYEQRRLRAALRDSNNAERSDLQSQIAAASLRTRAVEAEMRGEDGNQVWAAATLRAEIDDDWWSLHSPAEVAQTWERVSGWTSGLERDATLDHLRAGLRDRGIEVAPDATAEHVGAALAARREHTVREKTSRTPEAPRGQDPSENSWNRAQDTAADQDRGAMETYAEMMASPDELTVQAAEAAMTASAPYLAGPSARIERAAQPGRDGDADHSSAPRTRRAPAAARQRGEQISR